MITNPHRKERIKEFTDKDHAVAKEFYELMDKAPKPKALEEGLAQLIKTDPLFLDPYIVLAEVLYARGKDSQAKGLVSQAYQKAVWLISDSDGNWPEAMEWGWHENRHIMRAISEYAYQVWGEGKTEEALDIYRKLLKANPRDNQGVRNSILAIRMGLGVNWEEPFMAKDGPMAGMGLEAGPLHEWFDKNSKKFPEEFDWLIELYKKWE